MALATGMAGWVDALLQGWLLWRRQAGWLPGRAVLAAALAAGGMAGVLFLCDRFFLAGLGVWGEVFLGIPLGIAIYLGLGLSLGLGRWLKGAR